MGKSLFSDGNPLQGILGTIVNAAWLNKVFNHRHDGLDQDGSAPLDYAPATGSANAYAIALAPALTAHITGMPIHFKASTANTGACTLAINALAAVAIKGVDGTDLPAGSIVAGQIVTVIYTGAIYMVVSKTSDGPITPGMYANFPCTSPPPGWIKRNGALLSRTTYSGLYAFALASGNMAASDAVWQVGQFSPGDGATTFRIPDGRGEFDRNWDDSRGIDSGRAIGSPQSAAIELHNHIGGDPSEYSSGGLLAGSAPSPLAAVKIGHAVGTGYYPYTSNTGGAETRPRNVASLACIKY